MEFSVTEHAFLVFMFGHYQGAIELSDGPIFLGRLAGYLDLCVLLEAVDADLEADCTHLCLVGSWGPGCLSVASINPLSDVCVPGEIAERFPGARQVALALVEIKGLGSCGLRFGIAARRSQDMSQIKQGIGVLAQQVCLCGEGHRRGCEFGCFGVAATVGEQPGRQSPAEDLIDYVLASSGLLAYRDQFAGFIVPRLALRRDGSGQ